MTDRKDVGVKSALRALVILELLSERPNGLTAADICRHLDYPRSSTHGLLITMAGRGFVELFDGSRYRVGMRVWQIAQLSFESLADIATTAEPYMARLRDAVNEVVQLSILEGHDNVYVARCDSDQVLTLASRVGIRLPAYATGLGRVLLAALDPLEAEQRLKDITIHQYTPTTVRSIAELHLSLAEVRRRGFAEDRGEFTVGVYCVAMPVRNGDNRVVCAMSVAMPSVRARKQRADVITHLTKAVSALSGRLGAPQVAPDRWFAHNA